MPTVPDALPRILSAPKRGAGGAGKARKSQTRGANLPRSCLSEKTVKTQEAPSTERQRWRRHQVPRLSSEAAQATAASRHPAPCPLSPASTPGTLTLCPRS